MCFLCAHWFVDSDKGPRQNSWWRYQAAPPCVFATRREGEKTAAHMCIYHRGQCPSSRRCVCMRSACLDVWVCVMCACLGWHFCGCVSQGSVCVANLLDTPVKVCESHVLLFVTPVVVSIHTHMSPPDHHLAVLSLPVNSDLLAVACKGQHVQRHSTHRPATQLTTRHKTTFNTGHKATYYITLLRFQPACKLPNTPFIVCLPSLAAQTYPTTS